MKKLLVIYDANILIDFCKLDMVAELFRLEYEFHTVDMVWDELRTEQQVPYLPYLQSEKFVIREIEEDEILEVYSVRQSHQHLPISGVAALVYTKNRNGILLGCDKNLRLAARENRISAYGHLWVFDNLFESGIFTGEQFVTKMETLKTITHSRLK